MPPLSDDWLALNDDALFAQCSFETTRGSGPGGQHRNKTASGVRLVHRPSGVMAQAFERRSQHENRAVALSRLRQAIALQVRSRLELDGYEASGPLRAILPDAKPQQLGPSNDRYWQGMRELLDLFAEIGGSVADTAAVLGMTTGALSRVLLRDGAVMAAVNQLRQERGLPPLRR